jgi:hypothetical protein
MIDLSDEEILAGVYLRALHAQVGGAPGGVVPVTHLQRALGWEAALAEQIGRLVAGAGLVRLLDSEVRLTAEGQATAEEY